MAPLDLKVISCCGQWSDAKWESCAFIGFHCHWNRPVCERGRKEGRKERTCAISGCTEETREWRRKGGEREMLVGTGAPLVIPRLKASFNIYDLFRFNSTCKREHAFIFRDVCFTCAHGAGLAYVRKLFDWNIFPASPFFEERISHKCNLLSTLITRIAFLIVANEKQ